MSLIQQQFEEALKEYVFTIDYTDEKWSAEDVYAFYITKHPDNTYHHEFVNMAFAMYKVGRNPIQPYNEPQEVLREVG